MTLFRRLRLPSPALVVALIALVAATAGTATATGVIGGPHATEAKKKKKKKKTVRRGPQGLKGDRGDKGDKGDKGDRGDRGDKGDKGDLGSPGAAGTSVFDSSIPSGKTVAGAWGGRYIAPQLAANNSYLISYSFPVKAPAPLSDTEVNVAPNAAAGDPDATCTGSVDSPTAPPGKVCIYIGEAVNAGVTGFKLISPGTAGTQGGNAYGFIVRILDAGTVGNTATTKAEGTWAYTAP